MLGTSSDESHPPFLSDLDQQEVLDVIHAFKFLNELSATNS